MSMYNCILLKKKLAFSIDYKECVVYFDCIGSEYKKDVRLGRKK